MRRTLLLVLSILAAASPAAAQSCATLGGQLNCSADPIRQPTNSPPPPRNRQDVEVQGYAEATVSNRGASMTLNDNAVDSHGLIEFGFSGSVKTPCRVSGYGTPCE
jgi:hypothetical protein